jgi:hypothetical protein
VVIKQFGSYLPDETNSRNTHLLAFQVGGGKEGAASGTHWHATAKVWYRATDALRTVISWVGVETPNGMEEWTNPDLPAGAPDTKQLMNCVDCHNRVGHRIPSPDELVDDALDGGRIDRSLPYVKREAVKLLSGDGLSANPDLLAAQLRQETWFDQLAGFYHDNYPEISASKHDAIRNAIDELKRIAKQILYPDMRADWLTYPDNLSHRLPDGHKISAGQDNPGCFRCHGTLVNSVTGERLAGTMGGDSCLACHAADGSGPQPQIRKGDPMDAQACALCHVNVDARQPIAGASADGQRGSASPALYQLRQR